MPYRFTPGPFSGPAPLLHPAPPPDSGSSGPVETVRPVIREATRVLADQERVPAPDPGRYHPKPSSAPSASPTTHGAERPEAPASAPTGTDGSSRLAEAASGTADLQPAARVTRGAERLVPAPAESGSPDHPGAGTGGESTSTGTGSADGADRRATARTRQEHVPVGAEGSEAVPGAGGVRMEDNGAVSEEEHHNEVVVAGRITAEPRFRELPSGDHLATWRICVARHPSTRFRGRRVDSITCVSFDKGLHEYLRGWRLGDVVDVHGALRRRTWRGVAGPRSVCEVEATSVRFVRGRRKGER